MFSEIRELGVAGQKQVPVFSHVETTGGMGQVNIPVGESGRTNSDEGGLSLLFSYT